MKRVLYLTKIWLFKNRAKNAGPKKGSVKASGKRREKRVCITPVKEKGAIPFTLKTKGIWGGVGQKNQWKGDGNETRGR